MITDRTTPAPEEPSLLDAVEASGDTRALADAEAHALLSVLFGAAFDARLAHVCPYCGEALGSRRVPTSGARALHPACHAIYLLEEKVEVMEKELVELRFRCPV